MRNNRGEDLKGWIMITMMMMMMMMIMILLTETIYLLLGAKATQLMPYLWPGNSATQDLSCKGEIVRIGRH